jgi:hypothetical protein
LLRFIGSRNPVQYYLSVRADQEDARPRTDRALEAETQSRGSVQPVFDGSFRFLRFVFL